MTVNYHSRWHQIAYIFTNGQFFDQVVYQTGFGTFTTYIQGLLKCQNKRLTSNAPIKEPKYLGIKNDQTYLPQAPY